MSSRDSLNPKGKKRIEDVARDLKRYDVEAYYFLLEALEWALKRIGKRRHLTGAELSQAIRELAIDRFGMLAQTVLESWGVKCTSDFGHIVFAMVEAGLMSKTDDDSIHDFDAVYDFRDAFGAYQITGDFDQPQDAD